MSSTRIGLIIPSGGPEADYYAFEEAAAGALKFYFTISRVGGEPGRDHETEALKETGQVEWLVEAAERIRPMRLDAVHWACTSGSFVMGRSFAEKQSEELSAALDIPASSTSLAFAAASAELGLERVAVLATYPEPIADLFVRFLDEYGITVENLRWLDAPSGWDATRFDEGFITENALKLLDREVDAILVPDTALPSLHYLERLERSVEVPVLTANAVTLWDAQRISGKVVALPGYGQLLGSAC